jgi:hypothetical protein
MGGKGIDPEDSMRKEKRAKKNNKFRTGSHGCEARLYEFREWPLLTDSDERSPEPARVVLIAAITLEEALAYLLFASPDFNVHTVNCVGLIIIVSGSPLN